MLEKATKLAAAVAVVFGAATVVSGARVLFGDGAAQAGNYVPFVLWFNFLAGFVYVAAGIGLWLRRRWAPMVALALALLTALVFAAFGAHILGGGAFEARTVAAMSLRTFVWVSIAALALFSFRRT
ncbi:MAG: hypothetical protein EPO20_12895 [Betaproteobacteria bacterium]|nr:MAG: hypothetical protein EPO20_12895 [Betaproteobacteria bacterium]